MKRLVLLLTAGILIAFAGYALFAEQHKEMAEGMMMQKDKPTCPMSKCSMCPMTCKSMMEKTLVATEDGGVVLMAGYKLIKFDKNLNKVKEAQIEIDPEEMKAKMQKMMQCCPCPMCSKMHTKGTCGSKGTCGGQTTCPVTGKTINKDISIEYKGKKVYFCCPGCIAKFKADPEKYIDKLPQFKKEEM